MNEYLTIAGIITLIGFFLSVYKFLSGFARKSDIARIEAELEKVDTKHEKNIESLERKLDRLFEKFDDTNKQVTIISQKISDLALALKSVSEYLDKADKKLNDSEKDIAVLNTKFESFIRE